MSRVLDLNELTEGQLGKVVLRASSGGVPLVPLPYITGLCFKANRAAVLKVHGRVCYELIVYSDYGLSTQRETSCAYSNAAMVTSRMDEWLGLSS